MISFNKKKIAIFRALQLGDMLCAIPAIRLLKAAYPDAELTLIGLPWAESLVSRFPQYFDAFIHFPGYPGLPEQEYVAAQFLNFEQVMNTAGFDFIIQMQGNGTIVNDVLKGLNAGQVLGYTLDQDEESQEFMRYPNFGHEVNRHLLLMEHFGIPVAGGQLEFPLYPADYLSLKNLQLAIESKKYVCIHPGSRGAWRQWPTAHFAAIGDLCVRAGLKVVVTGTDSESSIVSEVIDKMECDAINLAGRTSLGAAGALIEEAYLLLSNCTGVSHVAAALQTPSLVISMDGEPERWGPMNTQLHYTIDWTRDPDFSKVFSKAEEMLEGTTNLL
ncbi:MAG: glycosyltransferase family 9 protein [Pedobacter sp.]